MKRIVIDNTSWLPDQTDYGFHAGATRGKKPCVNCDVGPREHPHPYLPSGRYTSVDSLRLCLSCYVEIEAAETIMRIREIENGLA